MRNKQFIKIFLIAFAIILLLTGAANWVIDPYGLHFHTRYKGFNMHKPGFLKYTRLIKLFNADAIEPEALFLGNSRILYLAPEEAFSKYMPYTFYNFSLSSGSVPEMADLLAYSIRNYDIRYVCYGLDYIAMNSWGGDYAGGFDRDLVAGRKSKFLELVKLHTSQQAIEESYECLRSNIRDPEGLRVKYHYNKYGSRTNRWRELNYRKLGDDWLRSEMESVMNTYRSIYRDSSLSIPYAKKEAYERIRQQCADHGIELQTFVNPLYKDQFELLISSAAYPSYIEYLEFLARHGGFWYFGGVNEITSDMNYYWDTQHPRKKMSFLIAGCMLSDERPEHCDELFGTFYDEDNIDRLLNKLKAERERLMEEVSVAADAD